jgi:hypothetical protein
MVEKLRHVEVMVMEVLQYQVLVAVAGVVLDLVGQEVQEVRLLPE